MAKPREGNELGETLRRHRLERGVSGTVLAENTGVTQGTISKIEHGRLVPDLDFLSKFAHTLRLEKDAAGRLMRMAGVVPDGVTPESVLQYLPVDFLQADWSRRRQETVALAEAKSTTIRVFNPLIVPGLLQTEQYARHVIAAAGVRNPQSIDHAVRARLKRQRVLRAPGKRATFIVTESALLARIAPANVLNEQIRFLIGLAHSDSIEIGLISNAADLPVIPPPAFYLFDHRVYIELPHGDLWLLSRSQACDTYRQLFDTLMRRSIRGGDLSNKLSEISNRLIGS